MTKRRDFELQGRAPLLPNIPLPRPKKKKKKNWEAHKAQAQVAKVLALHDVHLRFDYAR